MVAPWDGGQRGEHARQRGLARLQLDSAPAHAAGAALAEAPGVAFRVRLHYVAGDFAAIASAVGTEAHQGRGARLMRRNSVPAPVASSALLSSSSTMNSSSSAGVETEASTRKPWRVIVMLQ